MLFQINIITAYVDGSQVYGSSDELAKQLRSPKGHGLLDTVPLRNIGGLPRLPDADEEAFCRSGNPEEKPCFIAGDARVNENQGRNDVRFLKIFQITNQNSSKKNTVILFKIVSVKVPPKTHNSFCVFCHLCIRLIHLQSLLIKDKGRKNE